MATLSVTASTSPSPSLPQPRRFPTASSSPLLHGSLVRNHKIGISGMQGLWRRRRTLICAVNHDAKKATQDTVETDVLPGGLGETDSHHDGSTTSLKVCDESIEAWSQFASRVSGEWDGFGADFNNEGNAIELPESVVPEAYREWEVKVFDWQTQCPTLAEPEDHVLVYKSIQLLPTVGCEADAATQYSMDERKVERGSSVITAFAYQPSGCYAAVWQKDNLLELEHCLVNPQDIESRVRIIQFIQIISNTKMVLQRIRVFREQWYGPFRNGDQLGGCAIRDSAFASTAPMNASDIAGTWQGCKSVATFCTPNSDIFQELLDDKVQNSFREGNNKILLPKQLWCSLKLNNDGETLSEVGWLLDHGQAITSSCLFSSTTKPQEISIALETKASGSV